MLLNVLNLTNSDGVVKEPYRILKKTWGDNHACRIAWFATSWFSTWYNFARHALLHPGTLQARKAMAFPHDELDNIHFFHCFLRFFLKCASRYCSLHVPQRLKARHCSQMAPSELTHDNFNCCGLTSWMSKISFVSFQSLLFRKCFPINS